MLVTNYSETIRVKCCRRISIILTSGLGLSEDTVALVPECQHGLACEPNGMLLASVPRVDKNLNT